MKNSLSKNYVYNLIYQVLVVIIPIILIPYLSRVLEPDGVGLYAFSFSITTYFSYFALLGVHLYGTKTISVARKDPNTLKKAFWEIFVLKLVTSGVALILFYALYLFFPYPEIFLIQGLLLFANLIDITWYYTGNENFKSIVIRNSIIKLLTLISVFLFVKSSTDVWIYALILVGAEIIGQLVLWLDMPRSQVTKDLHSLKDNFKPFNHLKGMLILFLPQAIILLYTSLNVTMIGLLSTEAEVGYFDMSARIINTILVIATALGVVMIPRISQLNDENDQTAIKQALNKSLLVTTYLAYPMMIGLFVLASIFVPWFFGNLFTAAILVLGIYAFKIGLVTISNVIGLQYMIPTGNNKHFIISVSIGAVITLILNFVLIPSYGAMGAVISSLIAEALVTIYQVLSTRKKVAFLNYIGQTWKTFVSSLLMGLTVYFLSISLYPVITEAFETLNSDLVVAMGLAVLGIIGVIVFVVFNFVLQSNIQKEILQKIFSIFKKKTT